MVPATGPLSDLQRADIRTALERWMQVRDYSQSDVAKAIGTSTTYINNLFTASGAMPAESRDALLRDINNWLDREARALDSKAPRNFVETRVAKRLLEIAERLTERPDIAAAWGPAGIGKSITIEAICAEIPSAVAVRIDYDSKSSYGLLRKIYRAMTTRGPLRARVPLDMVVDKLRKPGKVATHSLLIVDQAHELLDTTFPTLMGLHDQAECSVLLVGTVDLKTRLSTDDDPEFGQLASRVGMRINLAAELSRSGGGGTRNQLFTVEDIRQLFQRDKVKLHPGTIQMLLRICNERRGTLRRAERLMFWAAKAARRKGMDVITPEHLMAAAAVVGEDALEMTVVSPRESKEAATA